MNSEDRRFGNFQDRHARAYCEIGLNNQDDRDFSSIDPAHEDQSATKSHNIVDEFEKEEARGPGERMGSSKVLLRPN